MPTYEYECQKCGRRFDLFQPITEPPRKRCPKCKGAVKRLLGTGAGLIFKGSGFYITDYRSEGYKKAAQKETTSAAPKTDSKPSSETKPASEKKPAAKKKEGASS
jgi:putative FmdB family regulatory protein